MSTGRAVADLVHRRAGAVQQEQGLPALAVAVARSGHPVCVRSSGLADVEIGREVEAASQFRIGSITKTFTAALTLVLAERGVLDLDSRVEDHVPGTPVGRPQLRQVLAHSGGMQREAPLSMWSTMQGPDDDELLACLARARMVEQPGIRWHYSNLGYAVLGQILRLVTGQRCQDLIDAELLRPLGLKATTWQPTEAAVRGYRLDPHTGAPVAEPVMDQGAVGVGGQLWSTPADLLAWGHALIGGAPDVLPATVVEAMHTPQVMVDRKSWTQAWGQGLILSRRGERILSGHTGAMPGFLAALSLDRDTGLVVAGLTNVTRGIPLGAFAGDLMDAVRGASDNTSTTRPIQKPTEDVAGVLTDASGEQPDHVAGVLGRWWSESDETIFTWRGGHLHAHLVAAPHTSATTFEPYRSDDHSAAALEHPDAYIAAQGRMQGELLRVVRDRSGTVVGLEWATYPYTRDPS